MVTAKAVDQNGNPLLVFGLSARNIELLKAGKPIQVDLGTVDMKGTILIFYGATEHDLAAMIMPLTGPETDIRGDVPGQNGKPTQENP